MIYYFDSSDRPVIRMATGGNPTGKLLVASLTQETHPLDKYLWSKHWTKYTYPTCSVPRTSIQPSGSLKPSANQTQSETVLSVSPNVTHTRADHIHNHTPFAGGVGELGTREVKIVGEKVPTDQQFRTVISAGVAETGIGETVPSIQPHTFTDVGGSQLSRFTISH